jgi:sarcosine oxidase subunit alpha
MSEYRIHTHPILSIPEAEDVIFTWRGKSLKAKKGEMIASALMANGIRIFGYHPKDGSPQGIFCANGQCAQCLVLADGIPVKSCMTSVKAGMKLEPLKGLPVAPENGGAPRPGKIRTVKTPVLILGGGPAGLSAAVELGRLGIKAILVDDKHKLGGKLVLQTHKFFGSREAVYAGTRGIDIATELEERLRAFAGIDVWLNSTALAVFSDGKVGILKTGRYILVKPEVLLVTTGARERSLAFKGNTLPGVFGAGAFQTLANRDLVKPSERLFIVGGGNVGLISGYHALQAGIEVVGLVEALPECGGYKVHKDKLVRSGVPIYTSHTIVSANGEDHVESVTIARINDRYKSIPGTAKSFRCDTVLIAVGLDPVDEFAHKAKEFGMKVYSAGDAEEIAEASAAMFSGRIKGLELAGALGVDVGKIPREWYRTAKILKSRPGKTGAEKTDPVEEGIFPVFHCHQEIPCNPCTSVCPLNLIYINPKDIRSVPHFLGHYVGVDCLGCEKCVTICPALAVTLVDYRKDNDNPVVTLAYEFLQESIRVGDEVTVLDVEGKVLGSVKVLSARTSERSDHTVVVKVRAPKAIAQRISGIRVQEPWITEAIEENITRISDDTIVCRCERVTAGEIRDLIRKGYRDFNEIKAVTRAGMGACGGKTCTPLIFRLFQEEGIPLEEVTGNVKRPLFVEVPLGVFAGIKEADNE